ncbi:hypothetical protein HYC85_004712 [Camellia sinensis]|uniref:Senescence domain-containing protein n=1 Tax=Camellia sinensis TaxID=4442 RepID=A0A7J7HYH8_CAMSI|nr:hypothetical protein HYC85_004712 [Camellia sinensis]
MSCCKPKIFKPPTKTFSKQENQEAKNVKHEVLLRVPGCKVHLVEEGEALELANGDFTLCRILDDNVILATTVKIGDDLQWPLTKDEPVVKLDALHYLFSLPMKNGDQLSYGVTFLDGGSLGLLDSYLQENSCFSCSSFSIQNKNLNWNEFAPRVEDFNNFLAKAIAEGTGQIVKGIFKCSNAYTNQKCRGSIFRLGTPKISRLNVQKGGEMILTQAVEEKNRSSKSNNGAGATKKNKINQTLKRVRNLSSMTEQMSKAMLDGVGIATGTVMAPMVQSQVGKAFLAMVPGQVLLASLDAVNKVLDAAEVAEKQALSATSATTTRMVSERFGENAGEATEDVLATCRTLCWHCLECPQDSESHQSSFIGVLWSTKECNQR